MYINVSDATVLQRLLGSPAVFKAKGAAGQKPLGPPVSQQPPSPQQQPPAYTDRGVGEGTSKPFRVADLASLQAMKSHVHDLGAPSKYLLSLVWNNRKGLQTRYLRSEKTAFSLREIVLTVLLLGLSVVYLFKTS